MPTQYTPAIVNTDPKMAGTLYHVVIGDGTRTYGYMLQNHGGQSDKSALNESTDINSRDQLIQFSSPSLIDQHLVNYPRVSQGDFSGGSLQVVLLDATKFFDSDLDINTPGYLQLRPSLNRTTKTIASPSAYTQVIAWNGDIWFSYGESSGNIYSLVGATTLGSSLGAVRGLDTDGVNLWIGGSAGLNYSQNGTTTNVAASALNGTAAKWWVLNQGTFGRFVYYSVSGGGTVLLYKFSTDPNVNAFPVAAGSQPQVPTADNVGNVIDLVAYQNGIALLTSDVVSANGFDVWFHDGANMTRIVRVEGYVARGMCNALGDLYVGAQSSTLKDSPILVKIASGSYEIVARPGHPGVYVNQYCGQPRSGAEFVYWPVSLAQQGISTAPYVLVYNTITAAVGHLQNVDATDFGTQLQGADTAVHRNLVPYGPGATFAWQASSVSGVIQAQTNSIGTFKYAPSGWVAGSKFDFGTPGIPKRFRRVEAHHVPLNAGESMQLNAYLDLDPLAFTTSLTPVPSTATVTNSVVGSAVTVLTVGNTASQGNVGRSLVPAAKLTAGTNQATTPKIIYWAVEVGGTWIWDLDFDCSNIRRLINGAMDDSQGVTGKDLYFMLRNAYENGTPLTLSLASAAPPGGGGAPAATTYTVNIESMKAQAFGYVQKQGTPVKADEEWLVHATLRQEAS